MSHEIVFFSLQIYRMNGFTNVVSLNLDDCGIYNMDPNPFSGFNNIENISLANNDLSQLSKGKLG